MAKDSTAVERLPRLAGKRTAARVFINIHYVTYYILYIIIVIIIMIIIIIYIYLLIYLLIIIMTYYIYIYIYHVLYYMLYYIICYTISYHYITPCWKNHGGPAHYSLASRRVRTNIFLFYRSAINSPYHFVIIIVYFFVKHNIMVYCGTSQSVCLIFRQIFKKLLLK